MYFGGDYNPEQWPEEVWQEDMELMREAGVNLVTLGVFSWARLEPADGEFDFGWLDRILDLLHANGIGVDLATPTAQPPPWFGLAHPETRNTRPDGVRNSHGSRDTYCVSAPVYREKSLRLVAALAARYGDHPSVQMWHVHNEYGSPCYCDHTATAFRAWLEKRHGSLEALNEAWTTSFWSQHYTGWEEILPPRVTQYLPNPAQVLDFRRFHSDAFLEHFRDQKALLRPTGKPVTTNFVLGAWVSVNQRDWAAELDLVSIDHYPSHDPPAETAFAADLARCWADGRPWLLMEQAVQTITPERRLAKRPGEMLRLSLSHIARGSRGACFFQWRASRGGAEQWHGGMVPHAGRDTRVFREITALGSLIARLPEPGPVRAEAAILWDTESWWALQAPAFPAADLDYLDAVEQAHRLFFQAEVTTDFAHPSADLGGYPLVVVPSLYLLSDEDAANLRRYVEGGGTLVVSYLSGIAEPTGRIRLGGYPGALRDVLGIRVEELCPVDSVPLDDGTEGTRWSEHLHLEGASALVRYADGLPAITSHSLGAGRAVYLSTRLSDASYARLLGLPVAQPGFERIESGGQTFTIDHEYGAFSVRGPGLDLSGTVTEDGSVAFG